MAHFSYRRVDRVKATIKKELSDIIHNKLRDPRIGFVTVTDVDMASDLRCVNVFISVFGSEKSKRDTIIALNHAAPFVRKEIGNRIYIKHIPEIKFSLDNSVEYANKIEKLLDGISRDRKSS